MVKHDQNRIPDGTDRQTIPFRWFLAFSFLLLTVHEAHELAHAVTARLLCDAWPVRDFNAWRLTGSCTSLLPAAAGPLFSYLVMLLGSVAALRTKTYRLAGIALIFAANPFARVFTAAMGGGDEMVVAEGLLGISGRPATLRVAVFAFVLAVCAPAIVVGWRAMSGLTRRKTWFTVVLLWPMVLTGVALFVIGNGLLRAGVLALPTIAGAPLFVMVVSVASAVMTVATPRWLVSAPSERSLPQAYNESVA